MEYLVMKKTSKYTSKKPDQAGYVDYTTEEHQIWSELMRRQMPIVRERACMEYLSGLEILNFSKYEIPQIPELNERLSKVTGWQVEPVPALIGFDKFFSLLSERKFPCATFIRTKEELEYLEEPDIFHELFGHCPMLTHSVYADFMQDYGKLGVGQSHEIQKLLARFYWFTVEFGLISTPLGLKCYGGGILSSIGESIYAIDSQVPQRHSFSVMDILRTPYRIDILQPVYYCLESFSQLYQAVTAGFVDKLAKAKIMPEFPPQFRSKDMSIS